MRILVPAHWFSMGRMSGRFPGAGGPLLVPSGPWDRGAHLSAWDRAAVLFMIHAGFDPATSWSGLMYGGAPCAVRKVGYFGPVFPDFTLKMPDRCLNLLFLSTLDVAPPALGGHGNGGALVVQPPPPPPSPC